MGLPKRAMSVLRCLAMSANSALMRSCSASAAADADAEDEAGAGVSSAVEGVAAEAVLIVGEAVASSAWRLRSSSANAWEKRHKSNGSPSVRYGRGINREQRTQDAEGCNQWTCSSYGDGEGNAARWSCRSLDE